MADPVVHLTNGVPDSGTGNITTLGQTLVDGANATMGTTTGAAVTTNAAGTLQQYLRGIVSLLVSGITVATHAVTQSGSWVISAGSAIIGKVGIDQTTDGTTNKVAADLRVGGVAVATGSGVNGSTVPRVALATDSPGVIPTGTAGTPSSTVLTYQGVSGMTPVTSQLSETSNLVAGAITTAMTGTTSTSLVAAPGASLRNYITQITVSNSHATVGTDVIIQDGSGGTTLYVIPAAAVYGGAVITFPAPLRQPTANTALYCANVTTGSSTKVSASGFKAA